MNAIASYLDFLSDFYAAPGVVARAVRARAPVGLGVLCFVLSGISLVVSQALAGGHSHFLFKYIPWQAVLAAAGLMPLVTGFVLAGIFQVTAEFFGARNGSASATFVLLGLCQLVYILYLPVVLTSEVFFEHPAAWRAAALAVLFLISFCLKVVSFESNYEIEAGRAFAVLVFPYVAALGVAAVFLGAMVGSVMSMFKLF